MRRLGIIDFHPIQYHAPLYQRLASRGQVEVAVLYLRDWSIALHWPRLRGAEVGERRPVAWRGLRRRVAAVE